MIWYFLKMHINLPNIGINHILPQQALIGVMILSIMIMSACGGDSKISPAVSPTAVKSTSVAEPVPKKKIAEPTAAPVDKTVDTVTSATVTPMPVISKATPVSTAVPIKPTRTPVIATGTPVPVVATPSKTVKPVEVIKKDTPVSATQPPKVVIPDGTPVTPQSEFFLELEFPGSLDSIVKESPVIIRARTRVDALVTVNDHIVEPGIDGRFQQEIKLKPGLNIIELIASVSSGQQKLLVVGIGYLPE